MPVLPPRDRERENSPVPSILFTLCRFLGDAHSLLQRPCRRTAQKKFCASPKDRAQPRSNPSANPAPPPALSALPSVLALPRVLYSEPSKGASKKSSTAVPSRRRKLLPSALETGLSVNTNPTDPSRSLCAVKPQCVYTRGSVHSAYGRTAGTTRPALRSDRLRD